MSRLFTLLVTCITYLSCSSSLHDEALLSPSQKVTSSEALRIAEAYTNHQWEATPQNRFHGKDPSGITVHTPDASYRKNGNRVGWWKTEQPNKGIPYKWGGFDTPKEFDQKLSEGKYAGDVYSPEKRKKLYQAISSSATGIDCSGFISRCWRLNRPYSTRELPTLCDELSSYKDLRPGDILNKENSHVILFAAPVDQNTILAYEAVADNLSRVMKRKVYLSYFKRNGYKPLRYKNMKYDGGLPSELKTSSEGQTAPSSPKNVQQPTTEETKRQLIKDGNQLLKTSSPVEKGWEKSTPQVRPPTSQPSSQKEPSQYRSVYPQHYF